jgi:hypothetical protein
MSKSVMLRTSNEDIKLNIDNYPNVCPNDSLTDLPKGWCYTWLPKDNELNKNFGVGNGACFTNTDGTAFQIFIADDRNKTLIRRCASTITDLSTATWTLQT